MTNFNELYDTDWVKVALDLLNNRNVNISLSHIARETGLSPSWVSQFAAGKIPNPSIQNVQAIIKWFDNK